MAIASYPRTIQNGQTATNGNANAGTGLMLWDSATNSYIAATPATFTGGGGGDATAANQSTQIAEASSTNAILTNSTNNGVLVDTFATQVLTNSNVALTAVACKYVTLINLSTNAKFTYRVGGIVLTLEAGYSVRINTSNSSNIAIAQSTGEGQTAQIIITS
jgi:hypothetical protein